jgi:hypothetical protein
LAGGCCVQKRVFGTMPAEMEKAWWQYLLWVLAAGVVGWLVSFVFSGLLHLPRALFLLPHALVTLALLVAFFRWSHLDPMHLLRTNWLLGVIGMIVVGIFLVRNVLSQPASPTSGGLQLVFEVLWLGVVYGTVDALLLSVLPVLAVWTALANLGWTATVAARISVGGLAVLVSILVTVVYHFGYTEYRGQQIIQPVIGNTVMSIGYVVTGNPISAIGSHVAMHVAAVLHGPDSTVQLPPHY